ncbi:MAG TPA: alpha-mannosidase [Clostridiaceae bacterium]|nr:alpha-mannosidase [Clostridiaceae bacterium]
MPYFTNPCKHSIMSFRNKVGEHIYKKISVLNVEAWVTKEPVPFDKRMSGKKVTLNIDDSWGKLWDCAWFNFTGVVPDEAAGQKIVLLIDISGEACIFDKEGCPMQGLTNVSSEFDASLGMPGKRVYSLLENAKGGESIDIWADAGCNDLFGNYKNSGKLKEAHVAIFNQEMHGLYYDIEVLGNLMQQLPEDSARYQRILNALFEASNVMKYYNDEEASKARKILSVELNKKCGDESLHITAVGHAHIDLAWLWPIRETIRKGARTFSTVLKNMEKYPDYVFGASQPQLYEWMKERYPKLYEKIKQRVTEGRWEPQGGMWVEADTNISGGEALVRQILYGKRFFREEFNKDMKILWLPDAFGYNAALPQILKKSGIDYFMTIKLSWNEYNEFPHHTFIWEGLDGSKILAHMPPEGTYNSSAAPEAIAKAQRQFKDKCVSEECLMLFGIGDGGGGPGEEHLERLNREKSLNGLVPVKQEPAIEFFKRIGKDVSKYKTWHGELYLEKHQGTYTTQARNKRYNRKMEIALRELEYASVLAQMLAKRPYPQKEIEAIWKEALLYQFHDVLPGSGIKRVYDECISRYKYLLNRTEELTETAYRSLYDSSFCMSEAAADSIAKDKPDRSQTAVVINSLSWDRHEWIKIGSNWLKADVPSMGRTFVAGKGTSHAFNVTAKDNFIENNLLKVTFNKDGSLKSVYDKEISKEALYPGSKGNILTVYDDSNGDAWDFSPVCYERPREYFKLKLSESYVDGPEAIIKQVYEYGSSKIEQRIILTEGSRRIDFETKANWNERGKMLRTSFPVNVYANEVSCDIQFGNIKRTNNNNTSWDMAKYEICAHKWVDLSQGDYGVALLNDCKYGHKVKGNVIDLNLLRSTSTPGVEADKGYHEFTYSLYPHRGGLREGRVARTAYELNIPLKVINIEGTQDANKTDASFLTLDADNVIVEAVKKAEFNDDIIVRMYENSGSSTKVKLDFGFEVKDMQIVNLMEEPVDCSSLNKEKSELEFKPFEIHTLRISM